MYEGISYIIDKARAEFQLLHPLDISWRKRQMHIGIIVCECEPELRRLLATGDISSRLYFVLFTEQNILGSI